MKFASMYACDETEGRVRRSEREEEEEGKAHLDVGDPSSRLKGMLPRRRRDNTDSPELHLERPGVGSTLDDDLDPLEGAVELDELAVVELVRLETRLARVATRGEEAFAEVDEGAVLDEGGRGRVEVELEAELTSADKPARERERNQRRRQR